MQIKTTMRYYFTLIGMTVINKIYKKQMLQMVWRKSNPPTLLVGM